MKILKGLKQFESDEAARALVESAENDFEERLNAIAKRVASDHSVRAFVCLISFLVRLSFFASEFCL